MFSDSNRKVGETVRKYCRKNLGLLFSVVLILSALLNIWIASTSPGRVKLTKAAATRFLNSYTPRGLLDTVEISTGIRDSDVNSLPRNDDVRNPVHHLNINNNIDLGREIQVKTNHTNLHIGKEGTITTLGETTVNSSKIVYGDKIVALRVSSDESTGNDVYVDVPRQKENIKRRQLNIMKDPIGRQLSVFNRTRLEKSMKVKKENWIKSQQLLQIQQNNKLFPLIHVQQRNELGYDSFRNLQNSKHFNDDHKQEPFKNNSMSWDKTIAGMNVKFIDYFREFMRKSVEDMGKLKDNGNERGHQLYLGKRKKKDRPPNGYNRTALNTSQLPFSEFHYPLEVDMQQLVKTFRINGEVKERPIFPYSYEYSFLPDAICKKATFLNYLIKSAPENYHSRNAIRRTWGNNMVLKRFNIKVLFLIGESENPNVMSALKDEHYIYKDILRMSFVDNYYNNTLKTIGAVHWVAKYCNNAKVVVFVDDDMFVSTNRLLKFIQEYNIVTTKPFYGGYITNHNPQRGINDKWYISVEDYPFDVYPDLVSAGFMVMNMEFVINLHIASYFTKKFIYDDVYIGIVAFKLHISPQTIPHIYMSNVSPRSKYFRYAIAAHGYSPKMLHYAWKLYTGKF